MNFTGQIISDPSSLYKQLENPRIFKVEMFKKFGKLEKLEKQERLEELKKLEKSEKLNNIKVCFK